MKQLNGRSENLKRSIQPLQLNDSQNKRAFLL